MAEDAQPRSKGMSLTGRALRATAALAEGRLTKGVLKERFFRELGVEATLGVDLRSEGAVLRPASLLRVAAGDPNGADSGDADGGGR